MVKDFTIISEWIDKAITQCMPQLNKRVIINIAFMEITPKVMQGRGKLKDNDSTNIEMNNYSSCQELIIKIQSELAQRCDNKSFTIKGCIAYGLSIDKEKGSISDIFVYPEKKVSVVYVLNEYFETTK